MSFVRSSTFPALASRRAALRGLGEYQPSFPAHLVPWEQFTRAPRAERVYIDPAKPGTWSDLVAINLSLQNQEIRNDTWYFQAQEHQIIQNNRAYVYQPEYPPYDTSVPAGQTAQTQMVPSMMYSDVGQAPAPEPTAAPVPVQPVQQPVQQTTQQQTQQPVQQTTQQTQQPVQQTAQQAQTTDDDREIVNTPISSVVAAAGQVQQQVQQAVQTASKFPWWAWLLLAGLVYGATRREQ
jgi:hypothetical protein